MKPCITEMTFTDYVGQEKRKEGDSPALKTALTTRRLHRKSQRKTDHSHQKRGLAERK